ncbi:hypothetical protein [Streptomyces sp. NPDC047043]|uniref:hypothetical protein n=1 Tax=Streptomyces sp. NPDC047043 TaxID=3154497 RepID=UPI0033F3E20E
MERTQPNLTDEALRRLIEQPSHGALVLIGTARLRYRPGRADDMAMSIAIHTILKPLPHVVRATRALPDLTGITRREAALRLRAAAETLG